MREPTGLQKNRKEVFGRLKGKRTKSHKISSDGEMHMIEETIYWWKESDTELVLLTGYGKRYASKI